MRLFYEQWQILEVRPPMAGEMGAVGNEDVLEENVIASLNRPPMAVGLDINDFLSISFTHHDKSCPRHPHWKNVCFTFIRQLL